MKKTVDVLKKAKKLISKPERWAKSFSFESGRLCVIQAIVISAEDKSTERLRAINMLTFEIPGLTPLSAYNDKKSTKHSDIMALFDRAIARCQKK